MSEHLSPRLSGQLETIARARLAWVTGPAGRDALRQMADRVGPSGQAAGTDGLRPKETVSRGFVPALAEARAGWVRGGPPDGPVPVIAEVKRRSPSAGAIAAGVDAVQQALRYRQAGACAISVLAEPEFFGGSPQDVAAVARALDRPVLFKDVVVHPLQLELARSCGARAVLLIAAVLRPESLADFVRQAEKLGLEAVVEVHSEAELAVALEARPAAVGVNNRDLSTFEVDPSRAERLLPRVPAQLPCIAESGYRTPQQAARALSAGATAVLIGEALMRSADPAAFLRALRLFAASGRDERRAGPDGVARAELGPWR